MDRALLHSIIGKLQSHRQAATDAALSGIVGGAARAIMSDEPRTPRNSWVVDQETGRPTDYEAGQIHPQLYESIEANGVIETSEQMREWLSSHSKDGPRDDWERRLFAIGTDCGAALPPSAWTSEGMYD